MLIFMFYFHEIFPNEENKDHFIYIQKNAFKIRKKFYCPWNGFK